MVTNEELAHYTVKWMEFCLRLKASSENDEGMYINSDEVKLLIKSLNLLAAGKGTK